MSTSSPSYEELWFSHYKELKKFKRRERHCNVPLNYDVNPVLGRWVHRQRTEYRYVKEGKSARMNPGRIQALNDIGFQWNVIRTEQINQDKSQKRHNGTSPKKSGPSPLFSEGKNHEKNGSVKKSKKETISLKHTCLISTSKRKYNDHLWLDKYKELKQFKRREGHCNVPTQYYNNKNQNLYKWVDNQRYQYSLLKKRKYSTMTEERIQLLEEIGFRWFSSPQSSLLYASSPKAKKNDTKKVQLTSIKQSDDDDNVSDEEANEIKKTTPSSASWLLPLKSSYHPTSHHLSTAPHERHLIFGNEPIILSVHESTITNAGKGLFLTYVGSKPQWEPSAPCDLGTYGPHSPHDIKSRTVFEAKNFVFKDGPSEWSFKGPTASPSSNENENAITTTNENNNKNNDNLRKMLFGKPVNQDTFFDITCDMTGAIHDQATRTLLPFVNEKLTGHSRNRRYNVAPLHHNDGSLHYVLRTGFVYQKGEMVELFVDYGSEYESVRQRKYCNTGTRKAAHIESFEVDDEDIMNETRQHRQIQQLQHYDDGTKGTCDRCGYHNMISDSIGHSLEDHTTSSTTNGENISNNDNNDEGSSTAISSTAWSSPQTIYTNMKKSINAYNQDDVLDVLQYFVSRPPRRSEERCRMKWVVQQISYYCMQMLYDRMNDNVPDNVSCLIDAVLGLFPRKEEEEKNGIYDDEESGEVMNRGEHTDAQRDREVAIRNQYLGSEVRKYFEDVDRYVYGMVEEIVTGNIMDGVCEESDNEEMARYLVVFLNGTRMELDEDELGEIMREPSFGFII